MLERPICTVANQKSARALRFSYKIVSRDSENKWREPIKVTDNSTAKARYYLVIHESVLGRITILFKYSKQIYDRSYQVNEASRAKPDRKEHRNKLRQANRSAPS